MAYTLLRHQPSGAELYIQVLGEMGHTIEPEAFHVAHQPARELYMRSTREGRDFEASMSNAVEFWTEYNVLVLRGLGIPEALHGELAELMYRRAWHPQNWQIFPEVVATLEELWRRGIPMAVVSNFVDTLSAVCERHGITRYFETIVCSAEVGSMKPDPRIFGIACRRLGVDPAETWHVGDNYWADVLGARAAGITPVLIDRDGVLPRPDCLSVSSLDQVLSLLDREVAA